jgi:hypothetical protein
MIFMMIPFMTMKIATTAVSTSEQRLHVMNGIKDCLLFAKFESGRQY